MLTEEVLMEHVNFGYNSGLQDGISCGLLFVGLLMLFVCVWFLLWTNRKR